MKTISKIAYKIYGDLFELQGFNLFIESTVKAGNNSLKVPDLINSYEALKEGLKINTTLALDNFLDELDDIISDDELNLIFDINIVSTSGKLTFNNSYIVINTFSFNSYPKLTLWKRIASILGLQHLSFVGITIDNAGNNSDYFITYDKSIKKDVLSTFAYHVNILFTDSNLRYKYGIFRHNKYDRIAKDRLNLSATDIDKLIYLLFVPQSKTSNNIKNIISSSNFTNMIHTFDDNRDNIPIGIDIDDDIANYICIYKYKVINEK